MVWVRERLGAERICERRACRVLGFSIQSNPGRSIITFIFNYLSLYTVQYHPVIYP